MILTVLGAVTATPVAAQSTNDRDWEGVGAALRASISGNGPEVGGHIGFRRERLEWTTLDVSALFLGSRGGFIRLSSGLNAVVGRTYIGAGAGVSRFDFDQGFILVRAGLLRRVKTMPIRIEARYEHHSRVDNGGTVLLVGAAVKVW